MTVGEELVQWMKRNQIRHIFGIPGGGASLDLINEAESQGIKYVLMSNEGSAAIAAAVLGDLDGVPGICSTIMGPGALNAVFGVGIAALERLPLILLTDRYPDHLQNEIFHQQLSHRDLLASVVKFSATLQSDNVSGLMDRAARTVYEGGRPGPVHIDVPNDALTGISGSSRFEACEERVLPANELTPVVQEIESARRPVLLIGSGARNGGLRDALTCFVDKLGMPFLPSYRAKGLISERHPDYAGPLFGLSNEGSFEHCVLSRSDLIIQLGTERGEITRPWGYDQPSILIDRMDPGERALAAPNHRLAGDPTAIVQSLTDQVTARSPWAREILSELWSDLLSRIDTDERTLSTEGVISVSGEVVPAGTCVTTETGVFNMMLGHLWRSHRPNSFIAPSATTTMGFSIPASLAASLHSHEGDHVLAFCGDGSFHMRAGDLATIAELQAKVILVVFNDSGLGTIRISHRKKGYDCSGLERSAVDIARIAAGYGVPSCQVHSHGEHKEQLEKAMTRSGPSLIEVMIEPERYDAFVTEIRENMRLEHVAGE